MNEIIEIAVAIDYATRKHKDQKRKNGNDYISHPLAVFQYLKDRNFGTDYLLAALFHDLLEDTDATKTEILDLSNENVLTAVTLLTKSKDVSTKQYIKKILENPIAKEVKNADRIHNLSELNNNSPEFVDRYLRNTKEHYVGKFSKELDTLYDSIIDIVSSAHYTVDDSMGDSSAIYKEDCTGAYIYDKEKGFIETDKYFWANLGDNALEIDKEECIRRIKLLSSS